VCLCEPLMKRIALVVVLASACASVPAEDASQSRQVQGIIRTTNSPFCPGKTLDSCPSPRAAQWRRDVNEWVTEGVPEPEIRDRLQARVPSFDLSPAPVKSGWVIPIIAILLSTLWLIIVVRAIKAPAPPHRSRRPTKDASLDARLDEELARLDRTG
jgi:cytochrome c-type biogenesis protein CcmH/NrfF